MKIMKLTKIVITAIAGLLAVGCYNKFEMPADVAAGTPIEYNDAIMEAMGLTHISIADMKAMYGNLQSTGVTDNASSTVYKYFSGKGGVNGDREIGGQDYYIKGKVLTSDEQGNVYKSLHIWDGTGAIELKLTNGLYLDYPCDLAKRETVYVYVKLTGLYLGSYRMMLSLGDIPTEGFNAWGSYKFYANSNIVSPNKVRQYVFRGEKTTLNEGTDPDDPTVDILVLNDSSYNSIRPAGSYDSRNLSSGEGPTKYLGRLIRFEGVQMVYAGVTDPKTNSKPAAIKNDGYDQIYPAWICTSGLLVNDKLEQVVNQPWYKWAYSKNNVSLYGQACVAFPSAVTSSTMYTASPGIYIVRTSGYSKFANKNLPKNGAVGSVMGIYSIYTKYTNFAGGKDDQATYQITVSRFEDLEFAAEDSLTDDEISLYTPAESEELPKQLGVDYEQSAD